MIYEIFRSWGIQEWTLAFSFLGLVVGVVKYVRDEISKSDRCKTEIKSVNQSNFKVTIRNLGDKKVHIERVRIQRLFPFESVSIDIDLFLDPIRQLGSWPDDPEVPIETRRSVSAIVNYSHVQEGFSKTARSPFCIYATAYLETGRHFSSTPRFLRLVEEPPKPKRSRPAKKS